jgi:Fe-S cluster biosynthesis and repair protein YggX
MNRFTRDGSDALEILIGETCEEIGREVTRIVPAEKFQALLLGGGYGRGEGGVLATPDGDAPYNDLEFFLLISGHPRLNERRYGAAIHALEHRMTEKLGIEVEFKILSLEKLTSSPTTMFYYDLVCGHRVTVGSPIVLDSCAHHADATRIPANEATRLMMNRCSGLLFAAERLAKRETSREDLDFIARNIAKAQLALGDVVLTSLGKYHWSCIQRHQQLASINEPALPMADLLAFHKDGVAFKLRPSPGTSTREDLQALHQSVTKAAWAVWSWQEGKRLGISAAAPADYAHGGNKCPETSHLKNALVRLRAFGAKGLLSFRYPREGLLNSLSLLLWAPELVPANTAWLSNQLVAPVSNRHEAIAAYERLWHRFN